MKDAIEGMNGQDLDGRSITVNEAQSRGSGGGGGGRGGGGGYHGGILLPSSGGSYGFLPVVGFHTPQFSVPVVLLSTGPLFVLQAVVAGCV